MYVSDGRRSPTTILYTNIKISYPQLPCLSLQSDNYKSAPEVISLTCEFQATSLKVKYQHQHVPLLLLMLLKLTVL